MSESAHAAQPTAPQGGAFATTHWSLVVQAGDSLCAEGTAALERLCQTYWYPLYAFVRRKGHSHEDACDLTQAFFARFLEKRYLRSVDRELGKFRTFLLTSLTHFLANEWDRSRAQRRGGGVPVVSLDAAAAEGRYLQESADAMTPERLYERRWAHTLLDMVLDRLAAETDERRFEVLKGFLMDERGAVSYDQAAVRLGLSVAAVTSAIHRLRGRFRALLFDEIGRTVVDPSEVEAEIRHLLAALGD
jgi:RNA polymerase sigma-70 factor (ECF subfamily)